MVVVVVVSARVWEALQIASADHGAITRIVVIICSRRRSMTMSTMRAAASESQAPRLNVKYIVGRSTTVVAPATPRTRGCRPRAANPSASSVPITAKIPRAFQYPSGASSR